LTAASTPAIGLTALTKMDTATRWCGCECNKGKPIKFVGRADGRSRTFYPDRMASRIPGMACVSLVEQKAAAEVLAC
jgi:signal recognition particle GTPase